MVKAKDQATEETPAADTTVTEAPAETTTDEPTQPDQPENYTGLNIYQKIAKITGEIGAIAKGGKNTEQGYAFIEYAAVAGELRGLFAKYGVVITPDMQKAADQKRETFTTKRGGQGVAALIDFKFDVINADQPTDRFTVNWVGEATDYGDKATNKAATAALKYYLMRQFNVSEKGEADADRDTIERAGEGAPQQSSYEPRATTPAPQAKPAVMSADQVSAIFEQLESKGVTGDDQKALLLKMAKATSSNEISFATAQALAAKITQASGEQLLAFLHDKPTNEQLLSLSAAVKTATGQKFMPPNMVGQIIKAVAGVESVDEIKGTQINKILIDIKSVSDPEILMSMIDDEGVDDEPGDDTPPATDTDEPQLGANDSGVVDQPPQEIQATTAAKPVDDQFKANVNVSLDALNLKPQERMRLLKDATGAVTPNNLSDDQWRAFSDAVDDKAIEMADQMTAGDDKNVKKGGDSAADTTEQAQ